MFTFVGFKKMIQESIMQGLPPKRGKCMGYIPVEGICFVFGIVSPVLSLFGIAILFMTRFLIKPQYMVTFEIMSNQRPDRMLDEVNPFFDISWDFSWKYLNYESLPITGYGLIMYMFCCGSIPFSVFLCYGIHKRSPSYLKAYIAYGIPVTSFMYLSLLYMYAWYYDLSYAVMDTAICLYLLVLYMVHRTYQLFRVEQAYRIALHD